MESAHQITPTSMPLQQSSWAFCRYFQKDSSEATGGRSNGRCASNIPADLQDHTLPVYVRIEDALGRILRTSLSDLQLKKPETHLRRNDQEMEDMKSGRKRREFVEEDAVFASEYSDPNHPKWVPGRMSQTETGKTCPRSRSQWQNATSSHKSVEEARYRWCMIIYDTFNLSFLPPSETPQAASEKANSSEPPDLSETKEVDVSPEPQVPRPARTRQLPRRLEMYSQRKRYLIV